MAKKKKASANKRRKALSEQKKKTAAVPGVSTSHDTLDFEFAGQWLAKHGLDSGVTKKMVAWVESKVGKGKVERTRENCLAALESLRGYVGVPSQKPTKKSG